MAARRASSRSSFRPYTRNTGVDHTHYTTTSMLRTMELMLGATPMSQFDAAATPMYGAFHIAADAAPYHAKTPNTNLDAKNAAATEPPLLRSIDYSAPATDDDDDDDDDDDRGRAARRASPAPTRVRRLIARKLVQVRLDIEPMLRPMRWLPD